MSHTPHELHEEFPEHTDTISRLKESDAHFARLAESYHEVNRAIHRAEERLDPMSEEAEESLRRERVKLKDEIARILATA